ncbi:hypothetical protein GCM10027047_00590 [Rhodococcus aerolatus]
MVLALAVAVVLMCLVLAGPDRPAASTPAAMSGMPGMTTSETAGPHVGTAATMSARCVGDCTPGAMTTCLAVLVLTAALLFAIGIRRTGRADGGGGLPRLTGARRPGRSPPSWTHPTLHQLSIIRV